MREYADVIVLRMMIRQKNPRTSTKSKEGKAKTYIRTSHIQTEDKLADTGQTRMILLPNKRELGRGESERDTKPSSKLDV
jgi:hypothetical protein